MKKSLVLSLVLSSLMYGYVNPLPLSSRSVDTGGTLSAVDAYQDGVGAMVVESGRGIDNAAMNTLVFKYGNEAKNNTLTVGDQVLLTGSAEDKLLAGKLFADGASCSDGNTSSTGETYLNGVCQGGTILNGTACDDLNALTFGDVYTNGTCAGFLNGATCSDENTLTSEEKYLNGICQGGLFTAGNNLKYDQCEGGLKNLSTATSYCSSKGMRLPTIAETSDTWFGAGINGVPACSSWTKTATINTDVHGYGYYIWLGQTYNYGIVTDNSNVRCVK